MLAFLAALALAKFRFYGRRPFIVVIFAVQMVPLTALIIPLYIALSSVGQVDKLTGVIISYIALVLPFCVWTLRGFIGGIPRELEEAAMVDGSTRFGASPDPAPARRPRPRGDLDLRLHPGLERVHHRLRDALLPGEADRDDLARELHDGDAPRVDWGTLMASR